MTVYHTDIAISRTFLHSQKATRLAAGPPVMMPVSVPVQTLRSCRSHIRKPDDRRYSGLSSGPARTCYAYARAGIAGMYQHVVSVIDSRMSDAVSAAAAGEQDYVSRLSIAEAPADAVSFQR